MPPKRVKKPKKPVQQKQKQKQSQRVVVNVNQARPAKRRPVARARQPQQVVYQPLITMSGSVPVPQPSYNPIQSSGGFNPPPPTPSLGTPISSSAPVELPVFADESVKVVGDERMTAPISAPVPKPVDIIVPIRPVIPDDRPVVMPKPIPPPKPIITSPPPSLVTDNSDRSKFIIPPQKPPPARIEMKPDDDKSVGTLLSELSKDTGINSKSVANFLFKKKKQPEKKPEEKKPDQMQMQRLLPLIPEPLVFERDSGRVEELGRYDVPDFRPIPDRTRAGFNIPADNSLLGLINPNQLESNSNYPSISSGSSSLAGTVASFPESDLTQYSDKIRKRAEAFGIQDRRQQKLTDAYNKRLDDKRFENEKIIAERLAEPQREEYQFGNDLSLSTHSMGTTSSGVSDASGIIPLQSDGSMSYGRLYPKRDELSSDSDSAFEAVRDAERKNREIARRYKPEGGFNIPSDNSIKTTGIIVGDAPPIVSSGSSGSSRKTKSNPYDPFVQSDMSVSGQTVSETETSMKPIKPVKKRELQREVKSDSDKSDSGANIIPLDKPAGRRLAPVSENKAVKGKSPYSSLTAAEITKLADKQGIPIKKKGSKGQDVRIPAKDLLPLLK